MATGRAAVVKVHRATWPSALELARTRHAFEIGRELSSLAGVVEHLALVPTGPDVALVTADTEGISLDRLRAPGTPLLPVEEALRIGTRIAESLAEVHKADVIHNRLQPSNILVRTDGVAIGDFADASRLRSEPPASQDILRRSVDLRYVSPEQTGRMNRSVDSRSDLYALGVILFELLTGTTPFDDADPSALVHAHIARQPPRIERDGVPPVAAAIVQRLLSKNAEDRYQEARGLAHDLRRTSDALAAGSVPVFSLGERDVSERLRLPEGIYGRTKELQILGEALARAEAGEQVLLFVSGYSGIGKSRLVAELQPRTVERHGWFVSGKFDVFRRNVPYLAWVSAMREAIRQALTLPDVALEAFRSTLVGALAGNGAALVEVIPEVELLAGGQPPLLEVPPGEAQTRFNQTFRALMNAFASPDHPLVVFLDDLQWADLPSLKLLEVMLTDPDASNVLVVGAWRDNEVGADHPLTASIRHVEDAGLLPVRVDLAPLSLDDAHVLITDALVADPAATEPLAALVHEKTGGNPFFLRRFVAELHRAGSLVFDGAAERWTWDVEQVRARGITDNVAELMAARLADYPEVTQQVLQVASCIGVVFSLGDLGRVGGTALDAARALEPALAEGLVVPMDASYRYATGDAPDAIDPTYAFLHDRVQETAHASLSAESRAGVHLRIARMLLASTPEDALDATVVDIASHLLQGLEWLTDPGERLTIADVLLRGARRARAAMAFDAAHSFSAAAIDLLPSDAWEAHHDLTIALYTEAAEVAYIQERFDSAERLGTTALEHARTVLERVPIHNVRIGVGVARAAYHDATRYAVGVLRDDFNIRLPAKPRMAHVVAGLIRLRIALRGTTPDRLLDRPPMTDPEAEAAMGILMKTATNAYWAIPNLVPLIAFRMIRLTLAKGSTGLSAYGYALYGMIATAALRQVDTGYAFGRLSMDLLDRTGDRQLIGKTALLWHGFIRHARDPLRVCAADVLDAYHAALDAGDVENAVYCGTVAYYTDLLGGRPLSWFDERYAPYVNAMLGSGQVQTIYALQVWLQVVANLSQGGPNARTLAGGFIDFEPRLAELQREEKGNAIPQGVSGAGWLAFMLDDLDRAQRHLGLLWDYRADAPGQTFLVPCLALYAVVLVRRRQAGEISLRDRIRLRRVRRYVAARAKTNPHDVDPFIALIDAERAMGTAAAAGRFLGAAELAQSAGLPYLEALAMERAATTYEADGHRSVADQLMTEASAIWRRYGAVARLELLGRATDDTGTDGRKGSSAVSPGVLGDLDVRALLETVRAVSGEIRLEALTERVMQLAVRNAGARAGALVLIEEGVPTTVATASVDDEGAIRVDTTGPELDRGRPEGVIDFVLRTHEPVVLDDAVTDRTFGRDPYVAGRRVLSVLCTPLERAGELVGALYLDNDLGIGVFTEHHLSIVEMIGGQAAVSIENARLYEEQRSQAEAFARFVPRPFLERLGHRRVADVRLGDAVTSDLVVLFSDLRGFTRVSESLTAQASFDLLNAYLERMEPAVHEHGGFIDKFLGDGVMALFIDDPDGAVSAGIAMHKALLAFNEDRPDREPLRMGVGLHAGAVMLGTVGGSHRMETTVIGDTVNTASRIEAMTKHYGTPLLVSSSVRDRLGPRSHLDLRPVGRVRVKGRSEAVNVHEVLDARPASEAATLRAIAPTFGAALTHWLRAEFMPAAALFGECLRQAPFDRLSSRYLALCEERSGRPVPDGWDGVDEMTEK